MILAADRPLPVFGTTNFSNGAATNGPVSLGLPVGRPYTPRPDGLPVQREGAPDGLPVQPGPAPYHSPSVQQLQVGGSQMPTGGGFAPGDYRKPTRQAVNDPGLFGQQAGAINAKLAQLLDPSYADVKTTDRDINPLIQTIDRQGQQTARLAQAQAAERAAADGTLGAGGFGAQARQIFEQSREASGNQIASAVAQKSQERQAQIMQALNLGAGLLDSQQTRNLQRELADLQNEQQWNDLSLRRDLGFGDLNLRAELGRGDLAVRNRGLDIQDRLGQGDLDLRRYLGDRGFDLQGQQIRNQNNQFYDRLGFDRSSFEAQMNAALMNGLFQY